MIAVSIALLLLTACGKTSMESESSVVESTLSEAEAVDNSVSSKVVAVPDKEKASETKKAPNKKATSENVSSSAKQKENEDQASNIVSENDTQQVVQYIVTDDDVTQIVKESDSEPQENSSFSDIDAEMFTDLPGEIDVNIEGRSIIEKGTINGTEYSFTIDLINWEHYTTQSQMVVLSSLFWQCYPKMYERFGNISSPPVDVILGIENNGYEIAEAGGELYSSP